MRETALIIVPAWNEASTLGSILAGLAKLSSRWADDIGTYVLVVDDGSDDGTAAVASGYECGTIRHPTNLGYGAALRTGLDFARDEGFDYALTMDADGQHRPRDVPAFLLSRRRGTVVSGSRYLPQSIRIDHPPAPLVNRLFTALVNSIMSLGITDVGCGMKCIDVALLEGMRLQDSSYLFPLEFWRECQATAVTVREIPVPMIYCRSDRNLQSKYGSVGEAVDRGVHFLLDVTLGIRTRYSPEWGRLRAPLRVPGSPRIVELVAKELRSSGWDALPLERVRANLAQLGQGGTPLASQPDGEPSEAVPALC